MHSELLLSSTKFNQDWSAPFKGCHSMILMASHSNILPGKSHGQRSLVGYSPWGRTESGGTERLRVH